jgi:hypothetical protein
MITIAPVVLFVNEGTMTALVYQLVSILKVTPDVAMLLVTPMFLLIPISLIVLLVLLIENAQAMKNLGCIECGAPKPYINLRNRKRCIACGSPLHRTW